MIKKCFVGIFKPFYIQFLSPSGLLYSAFIASVLCYICSEISYSLSTENVDSKGSASGESSVEKKEGVAAGKKLNLSVWRESLELMRTHTTLQILFVEVFCTIIFILSQCIM